MHDGGWTSTQGLRPARRGMNEAIPQWIRGVASRQAHVNLPPGTVEEEHSRSGFYGPASHLYRLHPPTDWTSAEGPGVHRAYDTNRLANDERSIDDDLWPLLLLGNEDVSIGIQRYTRGRPEFLRDADGDELFFVHEGEGLLRTTGRTAEAVRVIQRALDRGVNYYDSAPAYSGCLDYYGAALGERRREIFPGRTPADRGPDRSVRRR